jgi:hypothetical protein
MNLRRIAGAFIAAAAMCVALTTNAGAQVVPIASTAQAGAGSFHFTPSGTSGVLVTDNGAGSPWVAVTGFDFTSSSTYSGYLTFGPMTLTSVDVAGEKAYFWTGNPPGQTFRINSASDGTGTDLLTGWFQQGVLDYGNTNNSGFVTNFLLNGVVYDGGTMITEYTNPLSPTFDPQLTGDLSFELRNANVSYNAGTGSLNEFQSLSFTGSFDAVPDDDTNIIPVPEPGEYAVMGMVSLTLCGLMVRARRRSAGRAAFGNSAA